jgi:hypothetical protein
VSGPERLSVDERLLRRRLLLRVLVTIGLIEAYSQYISESCRVCFLLR